MNACVVIAASDKSAPEVLYVGRDADQAKAILDEDTLPALLSAKGLTGHVKVEVWRKPIPFKRRHLTVEEGLKRVAKKPKKSE